MAKVQRGTLQATVISPATQQKECVAWRGRRDKDGYGHVKLFGSNRLAHRAVWEVTYGAIPDKMCILHSCDTRSCINIHHLFLGNHKDNMSDMKKKNRQAYGERIKGSKLTTEHVKTILALYRAGDHTCVTLGKQFGVSNTSIWRILSGKLWRSIVREECEP